MGRLFRGDIRMPLRYLRKSSHILILIKYQRLIGGDGRDISDEEGEGREDRDTVRERREMLKHIYFMINNRPYI